jgi:hypothetical protein
MKFYLFFSFVFFLFNQISSEENKADEKIDKKLEPIIQAAKGLGINLNKKINKLILKELIRKMMNKKEPFSERNQVNDFFEYVLNSMIKRVEKDEFTLQEVAHLLTPSAYQQAFEEAIKERFGEETFKKYKDKYIDLEQKKNDPDL